MIKPLFQEKGWRGKHIVQELPCKNWNRQSVNRLIDKFIKTGATDHAQESGRPRSRTGYVDIMIFFQGDHWYYFQDRVCRNCQNIKSDVSIESL